LDVAASDLDRDGDNDIVVAYQATHSVGVFLNNGDGTFAAQKTFDVGAGSNPNSIVVADVTGEGNLDLILSESGSTISILSGVGDGIFNAPQTYFTGGGSNTGPVAVGDLNGD